MPGTQAAPVPVGQYKVIGSSDALPLIRSLPQKASLTIKLGTPVVLSSGYLIERTAIDGATKVIAGFTLQAGDNLASDGTAPVGGSGITYGSVPNQASAKNIPIGAPPADGTMIIAVAADTNIFYAKTDDAHTVAVTDLGSIFGLTKDSTTGLWFVDTTITAAASGACVEVTDLIELGTVGGKVGFKVTRAYQQLFT